MNASTINELSVVKASSTYKPKNDQQPKKSKPYLSVHANDTSVR